MEKRRDRLSELPDSIIFEIFGLLPMRDVVRTTFLSKRWNNLWTTTPYLNFSTFHDSVEVNEDSYRYHSFEFVKGALKVWKGLKILKFEFNQNVNDDKKPVFSDIDVWMRLANENGIEEFHFYLNKQDGEVYVVPHHIYSCASLKVLSLDGCHFQDVGNVQWNQLKSLSIGGLIDQNFIDKVISGSPQLEVFVLDLGDSDENISIRSSGLKKLSIHRSSDFESSSELRLWSPNLETLYFDGVPYDKYSLMNVSPFTHVTLAFFIGDEADYVVGEALGQILPTIQHVEKLTLQLACFKGLLYMKEKFLLSPLYNFKFLTIDANVDDYEQLLYLQIFPNLETLLLKINYYPTDTKSHRKRFLQVERNLPKTFLLQLRTVELTFYERDDMIFTFIEILLNVRASYKSWYAVLDQSISYLHPRWH